MDKSYWEAVQQRHSHYSLSKEITVSKARIEEIVNQALLAAPSAYNSQGSRVVLLFGAEHQLFWELTLEVLRSRVSPEKFPRTQNKIETSFKAGFGTILIFEDQAVLEDLQKRFPLYADTFSQWALESNGMLQYIIWTALTAEGLGASLQHYNPLVDDFVKTHWQIDENWQLRAQIPFGQSLEVPAAKPKVDVNQRLKVFGDN